jgi:regulatory protein
MPRPKPGAWSPKPTRESLKPEARSQEPYVQALRLLARRELSETQIRQRLARRGYDGDAIDDAVTRLKTERAIDDERTAGAIARTETRIKRRGRLRVRRQIEQAGIAPAIARRVVDDTFDELDEQELMEASLAKRLRGRTAVDTETERARLYRYLLSQGFEHDRIMKRLSKSTSRIRNGKA